MMSGDRRYRWSVGFAIRLILAIVAGTWLCWQIGAASLANLAARSGDGRLLAATGTPSHPAAGSVLAEALLIAKQNAEAARLARSVMLVDPTNDRALRVLGLASEQMGRRDEGTAIMRQAALLGWRDTPTQLWMLHDAALRGDASAVIQRTDALARRNRAGDVTFPVFLAAITDPQTRAPLIDSLAARPMWRGAFFAQVRQRLPAESTQSMEALYREMQARGIAIAPIEWLSYVDRLIDLGLFQRARAIWAGAFRIPSDHLLAAPYDGDFARLATRPDNAVASQFEWISNPDMAGALDFTAGSSGTSISIPADTIGTGTIVSQLLVLAPGTHSLSSHVEGPANAASAAWSIACLPSGRLLPRQLPPGSTDELSAFSFSVPDRDCDAQRLALTTRDQLEAQPVSITHVRIR